MPHSILTSQEMFVRISDLLKKVSQLGFRMERLEEAIYIVYLKDLVFES